MKSRRVLSSPQIVNYFIRAAFAAICNNFPPIPFYMVTIIIKERGEIISSIIRKLGIATVVAFAGSVFTTGGNSDQGNQG